MHHCYVIRAARSQIVRGMWKLRLIEVSRMVFKIGQWLLLAMSRPETPDFTGSRQKVCLRPTADVENNASSAPLLDMILPKRKHKL